MSHQSHHISRSWGRDVVPRMRVAKRSHPCRMQSSLFQCN